MRWINFNSNGIKFFKSGNNSFEIIFIQSNRIWIMRLYLYVKKNYWVFAKTIFYFFIVSFFLHSLNNIYLFVKKFFNVFKTHILEKFEYTLLTISRYLVLFSIYLSFNSDLNSMKGLTNEKHFFILKFGKLKNNMLANRTFWD
jgi:hypothetical protein